MLCAERTLIGRSDLGPCGFPSSTLDRVPCGLLCRAISRGGKSYRGVDGFCAWWVSPRSRFGRAGDDLEREKGIRWMPWHQEAKKDVARCEKPWGAASRR